MIGRHVTGRHIAARSAPRIAPAAPAAPVTRRELRARRRRARRIRGMLQNTAAVTIAVALAVTGASGTFAYLSSSVSSSASAATLKAGNAALAVTTPLALPTTPIYPGLTVAGSAVVTNTGTVPLTLQVQSLTPPPSTTSFSSNLTVGVAAVASQASCTSAVTPTLTGTMAAPPSGALTGTVAAGGSGVVCVLVTLPASAPASAAGAGAASFSLVVGGKQYR